jgi:hypothetical protein
MTPKPTAPPMPPDFRQDAQGRWVPVSQIREIDELRDRLVTDIAVSAKAVSKVLNDFKCDAFADIAAFIDLSLQAYGVRVGGNKGNVSLLSFDGRYKVQRAIAEHISFDERLQAAKELIDDCLREWTADARSEVRTLVQDAFRVDQAGKIQTARVLALRRMDIRDERWVRAMQAIGEAVQVVGSKSYVRVYERDDETGEYRAIPLDVAKTV